MKVKFLGATKGVTGSCSLLHHSKSDSLFLVDCGMQQGGVFSDWENSQDFKFNPKQIKFVLLTHAHLDHCGLLPRLYKEGFIGEVFCTQATAELARIVMQDSAKISGLYDEKDVKKVKFKYIDKDVRYRKNKPVSLGDGLRATFIRSSHLLGATGISINWLTKDSKQDEWKTIHFSGDIGSNFEDACYLPLLKHNHYPFPQTDYLVMESTYGGRVRDDVFKSKSNRLQKLKEIITDTIFKNNGKLIIPSFSIQRTQEILTDIYAVLSDEKMKRPIQSYLNNMEAYESHKKNRFGVYCDSPMTKKANQVFYRTLTMKDEQEEYIYQNKDLNLSDDELYNLFGKGYLSFNDESCFIRMANETVNHEYNVIKSGSIIVASSGMCDAGPIATYLEELGKDKKNTIILTGFQAEGSKGYRIKNNKEPGIHCNVDSMSDFYSAHSDEAGLLEYVFNSNRASTSKLNVFLNHGTPESKIQLQRAILKRAKNKYDFDRSVDNVTALDGDENWFDLNNNEKLVEGDIDLMSSIDLNKYLLEQVIELRKDVELLKNSSTSKRTLLNRVK